MTDTPHLGLPLLAAAQAQKHVTHNEGLLLLDALAHLAVLDRDLAAPPADAAEGGRWIVGAGAAGAWAGQEGRVALRLDGGWTFREPKVGWLAYVVDEAQLLAFTGSAWQAALPAVLQNLRLLGIGTTADAANPFSAKLNKALWTALGTGEGGDGSLRYTLNKEGAGGVLSLLMQSGFSGRAEIGLVGDDDLSMKVSPDGSAWREALRLERATGRARFPAGIAAALLAPDATRNRIVNGALQVSQEHGDAAGTAAGFHPADQWALALAAAGAAVTVARVAAPTPSGARHRLRLTVTTPKPALAAGDLVGLRQAIEGEALADLGFGTPAARPLVLRFGFRGPAGTYGVSLRNAAGTRAWPQAFTVAPAEAGTDTLHAFAVPGDTGGAWASGAVAILELVVCPAAGASALAAGPGWGAGAALGLAGQTNGIAAAGAVFELFDVGLYLDPHGSGIAPRFEVPDPAAELRRCQRYFVETRSGGRFPAAAAGQVLELPIPWPVPMRQAPAVAAPVAVGARTNAAAVTVTGATATGARLSLQSTAAGSVSASDERIRADARL